LLISNLYAQQSPAPSAPAPVTNSPADFVRAADEVLHDMSEITGLSLVSPLKKTLRSRDEIRAYVIRQMDEDKDAAQRYADAKSAEAFGLLPKNFDLDTFMVELLTEPHLVRPAGVEGHVHHGGLGARHAQRRGQRFGAASALEHDVGAVVGRSVPPPHLERPPRVAVEGQRSRTRAAGRRRLATAREDDPRDEERRGLTQRARSRRARGTRGTRVPA